MSIFVETCHNRLIDNRLFNYDLIIMISFFIDCVLTPCFHFDSIFFLSILWLVICQCHTIIMVKRNFWPNQDKKKNKIKISKSQMSIDRFGYFFVNLEKKLSKISSLSNLIVCHCPFPNIRIFERSNIPFVPDEPFIYERITSINLLIRDGNDQILIM